jgi:hypothetical protein
MRETPGEQGCTPTLAVIALLHARPCTRIEYTGRFDDGDAP